MFPLFETIRVEEGRPLHLAYHNERMNRSRRELFGEAGALDLADVVRAPAGNGVLKCRVTYGRTVGEVAFSAYEPRRISTLAVVDGGGLDYAHKYADRSGIEGLMAGTTADDILIVRNGLVTDASYANVAFHDGTCWVTPSTPLLPGTTRARLLELGLVRAARIGVTDLRSFGHAALMNAMVGFDTAHQIPIASVAA